MHIKKIKNKKRFIRDVLIVVLIYAFVLVLNYFTSLFIQKKFQSPPIVRDWMWELLPYVKIVWLSELAIIASVIFVLFWAVKKDWDYIPYIFFLIGVFQLIRALMIVLTPLGLPLDHYNGLIKWGKDNVMAFGAFPSGHLAYPFLFYLVTKKRIFIILSLICAFALLTSRGHYSIDLIGTLLLGFAIYVLGEKHIKKYFIKS